MRGAIEVTGLHVTGCDDRGRETVIVKNVSFSIAPGEVLALIGESGSGKSTIALALLGYCRPGCRVTAGRICISGRDIATLSAGERRALRGHAVAYVAQSAAAAFNPAKRIINQVVEVARIHRTCSDADARKKAIALFKSLALPEPELIGERYPHQISGGQLQRLMLAMALMTDPDVVVLDEPTTALDVTTQIEVLKAFKDTVRERGTTALYVSHDLAVVAQMANRIVVLRKGEVAEENKTQALLDHPSTDYGRSLLAAFAPITAADRVPGSGTAIAARTAPLLEVGGITAGYGALLPDGTPSIPVLRDVDLVMQPGTSLGVIGESGSGKSTLARVIAGLIRPSKGTVRLAGRTLGTDVRYRSLVDLREIQIVFQSADTALNPAQTVAQILARPLVLYHGIDGDERARCIKRLLDQVQLPANFAERRPAELSGGQKQRVNLARALAAKPKLILCDEVTSGLDTVIAAAILELLAELRREHQLSYLFISHDLSTVQAVCDDIVILYAGQRMQTSSKAAIRRRPVHPYAALLLSSIPELKVGWLDTMVRAPSDRTLPAAPPGVGFTQCAFYRRCSLSLPGTCDRMQPPERELSSGALIRCHRTEGELAAAQVA